MDFIINGTRSLYNAVFSEEGEMSTSGVVALTTVTLAVGLVSLVAVRCLGLLKRQQEQQEQQVAAPSVSKLKAGGGAKPTEFNLTDEIRNIVKDYSTARPDLNGMSFEDQMALMARQDKERKSANSILRLTNGGELFLGPMKADNFINQPGDFVPMEADAFVVLQGRQPDHMQLPHERNRLGTDAVCFFDEELNKMDVEVVFNKQDVVSLEKAQIDQMAREILDRIEEGKPGLLKDIRIGVKSIHEPKELSLELLSTYLQEGVKVGRSVRMYLNSDRDGIEEITGLIGQAFTDVLQKNGIKDPIRECKCLKDCSSLFFSKEEGKRRIQTSISFIAQKLNEGKKVFVFCHQGQDRSGMLTMGALLYMNKVDSRKDVDAHTQVVNCLIDKRSVVNSGAYINANGQTDDPSAEAYVGPVLDAVSEMLELESLE